MWLQRGKVEVRAESLLQKSARESGIVQLVAVFCKHDCIIRMRIIMLKPACLYSSLGRPTLAVIKRWPTNTHSKWGLLPVL